MLNLDYQIVNYLIKIKLFYYSREKNAKPVKEKQKKTVMNEMEVKFLRESPKGL